MAETSLKHEQRTGLGVRCAFTLALLLLSSSLLFGQAASKSESERTGTLAIVDFGGSGNSVDDMTDSFNAAVRAAAGKSLTIHFPCGIFRFSRKPNPIPTGIRLEGCGSVGSNSRYGTNLVADYDESNPENGFLEWDGSNGKGAGVCCGGTGGGIQNLIVLKNTARRGGTAIKLAGSADGYRAGFFGIDDVLIHGNDDGRWDHDLVVDGECCQTSGSAGIRDIHIVNLFAAQAISGAKAVLLKNAVNLYWEGGMVFPAGGSSGSGITITGGDAINSRSTNIFLSNVYIAGDVVIDKARRVTINGYVGANLYISPNGEMVFVTGIVGGKTMNQSSSATVISATGIEPNSANLKHKRFNLIVPTHSRKVFEVTWDTPFPDMFYTVTAQVIEPRGFVRLVNIVSQTTRGITVELENSDDKDAHIAILHAIAIHD